ncbi:hypothetical protein NADFUDRAFT_51073 [Nadsonia fulvescens var. elongata DSM 6958]|uniref:tRNA-splicing endonuclease subunit Sen15 domain-containing protein n=1 Tax=Nadsonia fulvescens var. elongata DSM 6958 TaxID=857566 RepID=A0A1E3PK49_9ASCO|nr:hypothetical protein NADFUDRAFT_51073 [Nadsonia fulvescens var. elongata DSM 6958]
MCSLPDTPVLAIQVKTNLIYHHLWSNFTEYKIQKEITSAESKSPTIGSSKGTQNEESNLLIVLRGQPPNSLDPKEEVQNNSHNVSEGPEDMPVPYEWILPAKTEDKWSVKQWDEIFEKIDRLSVINETNGEHKRVERVLMAMVTNDSTIVYYFINKGIKKPRKN